MVGVITITVFRSSEIVQYGGRHGRTITRPCHAPSCGTAGTATGYGVVGDGINTAIGNYCRIDVDVAEAPGWARAYNSRDEAGWTTRGLLPC